MSMSCKQMVNWAKSYASSTKTKQMTIDATFKVFVDDKLILMASGITDGCNQWFPILYTVVPTESEESTLFHLTSLEMMLGTSADAFFAGIYVLKDARAGIHCGVRMFFNFRGFEWHQQDCCAHLARVDGNLQQACKKYHIPPNIGIVLGRFVKQSSYAHDKKMKNLLLSNFETEFRSFEDFMQWWKHTYGGPFKMWARCDAPRGLPVSNQGHESSNKTFKKVHMPTKANQRCLHIHKALEPLENAISTLVREKV